ncbi:MAG: hypothetical protein H6738_19265 [Alphaproteobacteria bacterium]|nr:hypothetical protein [Alphaproteobacteria bacterium]MCB9698929.1 hypothetical protein [Alphaproteobacteria bacterium]
MIEISAPEEELGSAIEGIDDVHAEVKLGPQLEDWVPLPGNLVRGRFVVRPLLGAEGAQGRFAVTAGAALGHQWWTLGDGPVGAGGEELVRVSAPIGGLKGRRVDAEIVGGPWVGPIGLRVGPTLTWDRLDPGGDLPVLEDAVLVGGLVDLSAMLGPVVLTAGLQPAWVVGGERVGADPEAVPLPVLGDETTWRAGVGLIGDHLELLLGAALRETAIGPIGEGTLGLRVRLL